MVRLIFLIFISIACSTFQQVTFAQNAPTKQWDRTFGGNSNDYLHNLTQTSDGGYILGGGSWSDLSGDKTQASKGGFDYWLIKTDASGNKVWDKSFGGIGTDMITSVIQTLNGGYLVGGGSNSGIGADKSQVSNGKNDSWIINLDSNGNKIWDRTFGGSENEGITSMKKTADGGIIFCTSTDSPVSGDKTQASRGNNDYWLVKLDALGNKKWDKTFGGSATDQPWAVRQTSDGGFILGGDSYSGNNGDKSQSSFGSSDYWVIKVDSIGNKVWDKSFGGSDIEVLQTLQQTADGGYILGGESKSGISGNRTQPSKGGYDAWIIKLDSNGNKQWEKSFGGSGGDGVMELVQTLDGGFLLGCYSGSDIGGDKTEQKGGISDYWVVKLDASGNKVWDKTYGGSAYESMQCVQQTIDGGYVIGGYSDSGISATKSQPSKGTYDFWVVKLGADILGVGEAEASLPVNICPNPNNGTFTLRLSDMYASEVTVTVSDLLGRVILQKELQVINSQISEELTLPNAKGIYLLQLKTGQRFTARKIVIE